MSPASTTKAGRDIRDLGWLFVSVIIVFQASSRLLSAPLYGCPVLHARTR